jgi:hypothetical protein
MKKIVLRTGLSIILIACFALLGLVSFKWLQKPKEINTVASSSKSLNTSTPPKDLQVISLQFAQSLTYTDIKDFVSNIPKDPSGNQPAIVVEFPLGKFTQGYPFAYDSNMKDENLFNQIKQFGEVLINQYIENPNPIQKNLDSSIAGQYKDMINGNLETFKQSSNIAFIDLEEAKK